MPRKKFFETIEEKPEPEAGYLDSLREIEQARRFPPLEVLCPLHKQPLTVEREGDRYFAICKCDAPNNKHKNQIVWERT